MQNKKTETNYELSIKTKNKKKNMNQ